MVYSPKICCYGSCASRQNARTKTVPGAPGIFFIKFPSPKTDTEKCSRWVNACGRMDFTTQDPLKETVKDVSGFDIGIDLEQRPSNGFENYEKDLLNLEQELSNFQS